MNFSKKWIQCAHWAFSSSQERVSYDNDLSFFLHWSALDQFNLGDTSKLDEPIIIQ